MTRPTRLASALVAGALLIPAAAAWADDGSTTDPSGDAPAASDITRVRLGNNDKTFTIAVKLAKATATRTHIVATLLPAAEGAPTYVVRTLTTGNKQGKGQKVGATLEQIAAGSTDATAVDCPGIKAAVSKGKNGSAHVRVPQACFGDDAGTFTATVVTVDDTGDVADDTDPVEVEQG